MTLKDGWQAKTAVASGVVTVRELTHATSAILDELERQHDPVVVTRHGKIIALLAPTTARDVFGGSQNGDGELDRRKEQAERLLKLGKFMTAGSVMGRE